MGMESFNKNSNDSMVSGSPKMTKKMPIKINTDHILKYLSKLVCIGFGFFIRLIITNTGVSTPTQYNGERNGEIFFRKNKLSIIGRNNTKIMNHFKVHDFDLSHIFQSLNFTKTNYLFSYSVVRK